MEPVLQNISRILSDNEQIKAHLCNHLPANMTGQINKAIIFYQQTSLRNGIYCKQLELNGSPWQIFIQHLITDADRVHY
ncbi:unnamed protein product [Rotaria sp. Silwood1]|nr:unnamed protein product [Rotaria sp. Silwood1]CAF3970583.1 unnamed protein product [Rotaria sp. Silwood1]CAF4829833.1 unnamed protein product [Rotaria sp. Silwood1]CAF4982009.1 unnamed protein product [Rotaria sp. Silwood1]CAF5064247.1 unnamed protein product [Rotaria sp. Silwood1]